MTQIAERAAEIDGQILENERELTQKRTVIESYQRERVRAEELGDRRDEQEARLAAMQEKHDILVKTRELLSAAKDRLSEKYIGPTNESFRKYMKLIDPALTDISVDTAFNLTRTDKGATRIQDSYSKGTRDAMTLALRLALGDSLYEGELPPMIFDDPYSSLDDTRTKRAREALKLLADERQILYFTCSGSREIK